MHRQKKCEVGSGDSPAVGQWRFFIEVSGEQCVVLVGICLMLQWCVENWTVGNRLRLRM